MGKQKTRILKRKARELYEAFSTKFTSDFAKNKEVLNQLTLFNYSKGDRNRVAGFITKLVKPKKEKKRKVVKEEKRFETKSRKTRRKRKKSRRK